ncbi:group 2 glycosyl transferase [Desmospora sp. 8437]|nr:group 2 glycosyl transferase [Desmospora sp. 8437]
MESLPPGGWTARVTLIPQAVERVVIPAISAREETITPHSGNPVMFSPPAGYCIPLGTAQPQPQSVG